MAPGSIVLRDSKNSTGFINIEWLEDDRAMGIDALFTSEYRYARINFNASRIVPTGADNRPYNIHLIPVLIY